MSLLTTLTANETGYSPQSIQKHVSLTDTAFLS